MTAYFVTQFSIRCGHLNDVEQTKCSHDDPCQLGVQPLEIITEICKRCMQDTTFRSKFHDLGDEASLLAYWECRKRSGHPSFWGPCRLVGAGMNVPPAVTRISTERELPIRETWKRDREDRPTGESWCERDFHPRSRIVLGS